MNVFIISSILIIVIGVFIITASSSEIFKFNWNEKTGLQKIQMIVFYSVLLYLLNIILWFIKWKYYKKWYLNQEMKENKYYDIMEEPKVDIKEKDFLEEAEKEKKELEESYRESRRQTEERKLKEKTNEEEEKINQ